MAINSILSSENSLGPVNYHSSLVFRVKPSWKQINAIKIDNKLNVFLMADWKLCLSQSLTSFSWKHTNTRPNVLTEERKVLNDLTWTVNIRAIIDWIQFMLIEFYIVKSDIPCLPSSVAISFSVCLFFVWNGQFMCDRKKCSCTNSNPNSRRSTASTNLDLGLEFYSENHLTIIFRQDTKMREFHFRKTEHKYLINMQRY